jgi:MFS family permease
MQRFPIGKALSTYVILWGICVMCLGACTNYAQLAGVRIAIGALEAVIIPGFAILTSSWYLRKEQTFRQCLYYSMNQIFGVSFFDSVPQATAAFQADLQIFASIVVYFLADYVSSKSGGISAWRVIQFFLGGLTVLIGILDFLFIGTPQEVWWLNKEQKVIAHARVAVNASRFLQMQ